MQINELLCYAIHKFNSGANTNLHQVMYNFYDEDDIVTAKKALFHVCKDPLGNYPKRSSTDLRAAAYAHLEDILEAIKKLDAAGKLPEFVAKNLDRIPSRDPEDMTMVSVIQRLDKLEQDKYNKEVTFTQFATDLSNLKESDRRNKKAIEEMKLAVPNDDETNDDTATNHTDVPATTAAAVVGTTPSPIAGAVVDPGTASQQQQQQPQQQQQQQLLKQQQLQYQQEQQHQQQK